MYQISIILSKCCTYFFTFWVSILKIPFWHSSHSAATRGSRPDAAPSLVCPLVSRFRNSPILAFCKSVVLTHFPYISARFLHTSSWHISTFSWRGAGDGVGKKARPCAHVFGLRFSPENRSFRRHFSIRAESEVLNRCSLERTNQQVGKTQLMYTL